MLYINASVLKVIKEKKKEAFVMTVTFLGSKGGAVVRAFASHQCGLGSTPGIDAICGLSLLLVLSLAPRGFSAGTPVFPSPQKPTSPNSNSTRNQVDEEPLCGCATCKSLFIFFIYLRNFGDCQWGFQLGREPSGLGRKL